MDVSFHWFDRRKFLKGGKAYQVRWHDGFFPNKQADKYVFKEDYKWNIALYFHLYVSQILQRNHWLNTINGFYSLLSKASKCTNAVHNKTDISPIKFWCSSLIVCSLTVCNLNVLLYLGPLQDSVVYPTHHFNVISCED